MQITEITISYEATQSLSGYCNVRPGVRLTARLEDGEEYVEVRQSMLDEARAIIHAEIDDALIGDNQPPKYYSGPRYSIGYNMKTRQIAIVPDEMTGDLWEMNFVAHPAVRPSRQMSADQARAVASRLAAYLSRAENVYTVVDCSDGDLTRLSQAVTEQTEPGPGNPATDPTKLNDDFDFEPDEDGDDEDDEDGF
jgi:hypothetical protein